MILGSVISHPCPNSNDMRPWMTNYIQFYVDIIPYDLQCKFDWNAFLLLILMTIKSLYILQMLQKQVWFTIEKVLVNSLPPVAISIIHHHVCNRNCVLTGRHWYTVRYWITEWKLIDMGKLYNSPTLSPLSILLRNNYHILFYIIEIGTFALVLASMMTLLISFRLANAMNLDTVDSRYVLRDWKTCI